MYSAIGYDCMKNKWMWMRRSHDLSDGSKNPFSEGWTFDMNYYLTPIYYNCITTTLFLLRHVLLAVDYDSSARATKTFYLLRLDIQNIRSDNRCEDRTDDTDPSSSENSITHYVLNNHVCEKHVIIGQSNARVIHFSTVLRITYAIAVYTTYPYTCMYKYKHTRAQSRGIDTTALVSCIVMADE